MPRATLRSPYQWTVIERADAQALGLKVEPLGGPLQAKDVGLVVDTSVWVEVPLAQGWMVAFRLSPQDGQPVIGEIRLFPDESNAPYKDGTRWRRPAGRWSGDYPGASAAVPRGGITASVLRTIRMLSFKGLLRRILNQHAAAFRSADLGLPLTSARPMRRLGRKGGQTRNSPLSHRPTNAPIWRIARPFRPSPKPTGSQ